MGQRCWEEQVCLMNSVWADTIFVPGYYFLNEINAAPSLVGMAQMLTRTSNDLVGAISNYFKVNSLVITKYLLLFVFRAYKLRF